VGQGNPGGEHQGGMTPIRFRLAKPSLWLRVPALRGTPQTASAGLLPRADWKAAYAPAQHRGYLADKSHVTYPPCRRSCATLPSPEFSVHTGQAPRVVLRATHEGALRHCSLATGCRRASSATGDQAGAGRVAITQLAGSEDCSTIGVGEHRPCVAGRPYNRQGTLSCRTAGAGNYVERDRILLRNGRSVASNGRPVPPRNLICVVDSWVDAWSVFSPPRSGQARWDLPNRVAIYCLASMRQLTST
jgi:hypothetical protein